MTAAFPLFLLITIVRTTRDFQIHWLWERSAFPSRLDIASKSLPSNFATEQNCGAYWVILCLTCSPAKLRLLEDAWNVLLLLVFTSKLFMTLLSPFFEMKTLPSPEQEIFSLVTIHFKEERITFLHFCWHLALGTLKQMLTKLLYKRERESIDFSPYFGVDGEKRNK